MAMHGRDSSPPRPGGGIGQLLLLKLACCGLPLLLLALASAGLLTAANLALGLPVLVAVAVFGTLVYRRRHCASCPIATAPEGRRR